MRHAYVAALPERSTACSVGLQGHANKGVDCITVATATLGLRAFG